LLLLSCLRKWSRHELALASVVVPATFVFFATFASTAFAGNFFATGHDQDYHCTNGGDDGTPSPGECAYYMITTTFVRGGSPLPLLILDRDSTSDGAAGSSDDAVSPLEAVTSLNLAYSNLASTTPTPSSPPYVVEDPEGLQPTIINGAPPSGITTSSTWATTPLVDSGGHPLWSAIIVASDTNCSGCDLNNIDGTHVDSDDINARTSAIDAFFNDGGGLLYLAGASDAFDADGVTGEDVYYASVPVPIGGQPVNPPFTVTSAGAALGITSAMSNCCATHNSFSLPGASSPLSVAETDSSGLAESVFLQAGSVCTSGFCVTLPPVVQTGAASGVSQGGAILNGTVNPQGSTVSSCEFEWGLSTAYGNSVPCAQAAGSGGSAVPVSATLSGLSPGVTYHFQVVAANSGGTSDGGDGSFTTLAAPVVAASAPTVNGASGAGFAGSVDPEGSSTTARFEYGLDPKYSGGGPVVYDQSTPDQVVGSDFSDHPVSAPASGLVPNALYHVRLVASNSVGTVVGADQTFTTGKAPAPSAPTLGRTANVIPVSGLVFIKPPAGKTLYGVRALAAGSVVKGQGFIPLTQARQVPTGSEIDARRGTLELVVASTKKHHTWQARLAGSVFSPSQARSGLQKGLTTFTLRESAFAGAPSYASCSARNASIARAGPDAQLAKLSPKVLQTLKASDHSGKFRTKGRYSAATVRGTNWWTEDRCDGTLTIVKRGSVSVFDDHTRKTIIVTAGHSHLAKA
jgi:hypothetical protein